MYHGSAHFGRVLKSLSHASKSLVRGVEVNGTGVEVTRPLVGFTRPRIGPLVRVFGIVLEPCEFEMRAILDGAERTRRAHRTTTMTPLDLRVGFDSVASAPSPFGLASLVCVAPPSGLRSMLLLLHISLRPGCLEPVALHPASQRRSYRPITAAYSQLDRRDFHPRVHRCFPAYD